MNDFQMSFLASEHRSDLRAEADRARRARVAGQAGTTSRETRPVARRSLRRLHIGRVAIF